MPKRVSSKSSLEEDDATDLRIPPYPRFLVMVIVAGFFHHWTQGILNVSFKSMVKAKYGIEASTKALRFGLVVHYLSSIIAAYLSDNILGNYRVLLGVYPLCMAASIGEAVSLLFGEYFIQACLFYILNAMVGIIYCSLVVFGADQLKLPAHKKYLPHYFVWHRVSANIGEVLGKLIIVILNITPYCDEGKACQPALILGVFLIFLAYVTFLIGISRYTKYYPRRSDTLKPFKILGCFLYALYGRCRKSKKSYRHWLDYSEEKYGAKLVSEVKVIYDVSVIFAALVVFWTMGGQQNEKWPELAAKMDGRLTESYDLSPEHIPEIDKVCTTFWLLLSTFGVFNIMYRCRLVFPLQYVIFGGFVTCLSFVICVALAFAVAAYEPQRIIPDGVGQLRIYNPTSCVISMQIMDIDSRSIYVKPMSYKVFESIAFTGDIWLKYNLFTVCNQKFPVEGLLNLTEKMAVGYYFNNDRLVHFEDSITQPSSMSSRVRVLANCKEALTEKLEFIYGKVSIGKIDVHNTTAFEASPGLYKIKSTSILLSCGEVAALLYDTLGGQANSIKKITITVANSISIKWIIPQYLVSSLGYTIMGFNGMRFSYVEAPNTMKTTFQMLWMLCVGIGFLLQWPLEAIQLFQTLGENLMISCIWLLMSVLLVGLFAASYEYRRPDLYIYSV